MKTVIIDPGQSGISGDMLLSSLTDLFGAHTAVNDFLSRLTGLYPEVKATYQTVKKAQGGIEGTLLEFEVEKDFPGGTVKTLLNLGERISENSLQGLSPKAAKFAWSVLEKIIEAEAAVHGISPSETDQMHFHELNSIDTFVDIFGVGMLLEKFVSSDTQFLGLPVSIGTGQMRFSHGEFSIPGPAVTKLLAISAYPSFQVNISHELATVTGIALLTSICHKWVSRLPIHTKYSVGIGHGKKSFPNRPNFLKVQITDILNSDSDDTHDMETDRDRIAVLETNLDDVNGEIMGYAFETLQQNPDVLDVSLYPLMMKKNRPGQCLRVLCSLGKAEGLSQEIIHLTGSLGVRMYLTFRHKSVREVFFESVTFEGQNYSIRVKISRYQGKIVNVKPEYEDLKLIAQKTGLSVRQIQMQIESDLLARRYRS